MSNVHPSTQIVKFSFDNDTLEAICESGAVWFALKPICEALGIGLSAQMTKLKNQAWAGMSLIDMTAADGKSYRTFCIDRQTLLMWLATIDANRVADHVRPKLEVYQKDIAKKIDELFFPSQTVTPRLTTPDEIRAAIAPIFIELAKPLIDELVTTKLEAQLTADPRVALKAYVSAKELLDEAKVPPKKRRGLVVSVSSKLRDFCSRIGKVPMRCARTATWLFPVEAAETWVTSTGRGIIASHIAMINGQTVLPFPEGGRRGKKVTP